MNLLGKIFGKKQDALDAPRLTPPPASPPPPGAPKMMKAWAAYVPAQGIVQRMLNEVIGV
jgi:hypothetical protein